MNNNNNTNAGTTVRRPPGQGLSKSARRRRARRARQQAIQQQPRNPRQPRRRGNRNQTGERLSSCAREYLTALEDPFQGLPACVPDVLVMPTKKSVYRIHNAFGNGTANFGYVAVAPWMMSYGLGPSDAETFYSVWSSTANYPYAYIRSMGVLGNTKYVSNSPYLITDPSSAYRRRLVSCGLRIRYIGPEDSMGGMILLVETPSHEDVDTFAFEQIQAYDTYRSFVPSREWTSVVYHPVDSDELDFVSYSDGIGTGATATFQRRFSLAAVFIPSSPSNTMNFEFEVVATFEEVGQKVRGLSPSYADVVGLGSVLSATSLNETRKPRTGERSNWVTRLATIIGQQGGQFLSRAGQGLIQGGIQGINNSLQQMTLGGPVITSL